MSHPLQPLLAARQWIIVRLVPLPTGKTDKLPIDPRTGQVTAAGSGGAHNPGVWLDYVSAMTAAAALGANHTVGFVITAADPFWCLDIDNCKMPDGTWSPLAQNLVTALPGTAIEISQSGRGLHIWGQGPVPEHRKKNAPLGIELYSELRFIAIGTGHTGSMAATCPAVAAVVADYFAPDQAGGVEIPETGPSPEWRGPTDDAELIRRMLRPKGGASMFSDKARLADLWHGETAALARSYPPDASSSEPYDRSSADGALAFHLAWWTGRDVARIERLMRQTPLARPKWDDRRDYLIERTIRSACRKCLTVLQDPPPPQPPGPPPAPDQAAPDDDQAAPAEMTKRAEKTVLGPTEQAALFSGCVYIIEQHRVMVKGGYLRTPAQFKASFGGRVFLLDTEGTKTTRDAFEAFTLSQAYKAPQADGVAFRPDLPYGAIVTAEGRTRANMYWPAEVPRVKGNVTPYLDHMHRLLPDEGDFRTLLYHNAGQVQYRGVKNQWFPLLVGIEGNGKSFISRALARAVGERYTHWPDASKLGGNFNSWLFGKLLYCIEDLKIGDQADLWEKLKPLITGDRIEIEAKGIDQRTDEIFGNFIANSNHRDAIRATLGDRRVCHLWTAQSTLEDLARDGMDGEYSSRLYNWANNGGWANISEYLHTVPIPPEYGIDWLKGRAPRTSSTQSALAAGVGRLEQEVMEQIGMETVGFRGDFVSSFFLDQLLTRNARGLALPNNKRRSMMQGIGYDWHPALGSEGRTTRTVSPDGNKIRIYCRRGSPAWSLATAGEVMATYTAAQLKPMDAQS